MWDSGPSAGLGVFQREDIPAVRGTCAVGVAVTPAPLGMWLSRWAGLPAAHRKERGQAATPAVVRPLQCWKLARLPHSLRQGSLLELWTQQLRATSFPGYHGCP